MRTLSPLALVASLILPAAACGSSSSEGPADAAVDSPQLPRVQRVNCPATVAVEITEIVKNASTMEFDYSPNPAMVRAGSVVRFRSGEIHRTRSFEAGLFEIEPGQTECYKFNTKETHRIFCVSHGFMGSIVIQ
jgi:hypothetical protein